MPQAPEGFEPVPSWKVTSVMLREWGFPVHERGHIVGSSFILHKGDRFDVAIEKATKAGFVRFKPSAPDDERWWTKPQAKPEMDPIVGAYFMRILRKEDRRG